MIIRGDRLVEKYMDVYDYEFTDGVLYMYPTATFNEDGHCTAIMKAADERITVVSK